jgi:hypothetical protein
MQLTACSPPDLCWAGSVTAALGQQYASFNELERRLTAAPGLRQSQSPIQCAVGGTDARWRPSTSKGRTGEGTAYGGLAPRYAGYLPRLNPDARTAVHGARPRSAAFVAILSRWRGHVSAEDLIGKRILVRPQGQWTIRSVYRRRDEPGRNGTGLAEYCISAKHSNISTFKNQELPMGWRLPSRSRARPSIRSWQRFHPRYSRIADLTLPVEIETMHQRLRATRGRASVRVPLAVFGLGVTIASAGLFGDVILVAQRTRDWVRIAPDARGIVRKTLAWLHADGGGCCDWRGGSLAAARRSLLFQSSRAIRQRWARLSCGVRRGAGGGAGLHFAPHGRS